MEIRNRISQGKKTIERLNKMWRSDVIARNNKKKIYNTIVKSILLYGSEAWRMIEAEKKKTVSFRNGCIKTIL